MELQLAIKRFNLGDKVQFRTSYEYSPNPWHSGTIVAIHYHEHKSEIIHRFTVSYLVQYGSIGNYPLTKWIYDRQWFNSDRSQPYVIRKV